MSKRLTKQLTNLLDEYSDLLIGILNLESSKQTDKLLIKVLKSADDTHMMVEQMIEQGYVK